MGAISSLYGSRTEAQVKSEKEKRDMYAKELGMLHYPPPPPHPLFFQCSKLICYLNSFANGSCETEEGRRETKDTKRRGAKMEGNTVL
jgi:hypothetical protein